MRGVSTTLRINQKGTAALFTQLGTEWDGVITGSESEH